MRKFTHYKNLFCSSVISPVQATMPPRSIPARSASTGVTKHPLDKWKNVIPRKQTPEEYLGSG